MTLELHGDWLSQPARAVFALANIEASKMGDFKIVEMSIRKGDQKTPEYKAINPMAKVPALREVREGEPDFNMFESHAIMKYMCKSRDLSEHWYPHKQPMSLERLRY
jgi:glutathione S-transferase